MDTLEIPKAGFGKIRGLDPRIVGTMGAPSCIDGEVGLVIAVNVRTRGANPPMAGGTCLFPESDDLGSTGVSTISSMITEEEGAKATWPRHFSKYSSQSFLDPTDIACSWFLTGRLEDMSWQPYNRLFA